MSVVAKALRNREWFNSTERVYNGERLIKLQRAVPFRAGHKKVHIRKRGSKGGKRKGISGRRHKLVSERKPRAGKIVGQNQGGCREKSRSGRLKDKQSCNGLPHTTRKGGVWWRRKIKKGYRKARELEKVVAQVKDLHSSIGLQQDNLIGIRCPGEKRILKGDIF